jgi:hypothetical protein
VVKKNLGVIVFSERYKIVVRMGVFSIQLEAEHFFSIVEVAPMNSSELWI